MGDISDPLPGLGRFGEDLGKARVEPTAAQRKHGTVVYQLFRSYVDAGFTREEALDLLKDLMRPMYAKMIGKMDID